MDHYEQRIADARVGVDAVLQVDHRWSKRQAEMARGIALALAGERGTVDRHISNLTRRVEHAENLVAIQRQTIDAQGKMLAMTERLDAL